MAIYTNSKGEELIAEEMNFTHLESAIKKMERTDPGNPELGPLKVVYDNRKAAWEASQTEQRG